MENMILEGKRTLVDRVKELLGKEPDPVLVRLDQLLEEKERIQRSKEDQLRRAKVVFENYGDQQELLHKKHGQAKTVHEQEQIDLQVVDIEWKKAVMVLLSSLLEK